MCISESGRLISDITEICGKENIPGSLVTMDLEKALDHDFLLCALKKFGFGDSFTNWIKILLNDQQSSIINGGFATQYFTLKRGARQGDPISAYLFIIALEVLFALIKNKVKERSYTIIHFYSLPTKMPRLSSLKTSLQLKC